MRRGLAVGALALLVFGGAIALAVQQRDTACERLEAAVEREDYASFEQQQAVQARAIAECMAEEARTGPK